MIAKSGRPFADGDFVNNCTIAASKKLCPDATNKLQTTNMVSLNLVTIQRRISALSQDVTRQLADKVANFCYFSVAADESTDIDSTAQLLVFVRGVSSSFEITEELLGMGSIKGKTTGADLLDETLELCITPDGAPAMTGQTNGLVSLLSRHLGTGNRELVKFHCIIHQQNLCGKDLGFQDLMTLASLTDKTWQADLTFLVDITEHLNRLNVQLQGENQLVCHLANHVAGFKVKLKLFIQQAESWNFVHFPTFWSLLQKNPDICTNINAEKLQPLVTVFDDRFADFDQHSLQMKVFADPFAVPVEDVSPEYQLELIDMQSSDTMRAAFRDKLW